MFSSNTNSNAVDIEDQTLKLRQRKKIIMVPYAKSQPTTSLQDSNLYPSTTMEANGTTIDTNLKNHRNHSNFNNVNNHDRHHLHQNHNHHEPLSKDDNNRKLVSDQMSLAEEIEIARLESDSERHSLLHDEGRRHLGSGSETETDEEKLIRQDGGDGDNDVVVLKDLPDESSWTIAWQVTIPFLIAGLGMVGAGLVLDIVQHWEVFRTVSEVFILVPALLGLKGNLEMTLASRLSTQANLGKMDTSAELWKMIVGNLALIQCQATVVGFLASVAAMVMGWIPDGIFDFNHALILCASSIATAVIASFVLGAIMIGVVVLSRKCNINPDNVATPIAASLGDLTTLSLLSGISSLLYSCIDKQVWLAPTIILGFLLITPLWILLAKRNPYTSEVLYNGWTPVISAMAISSIGGLILDFTVTHFKGIAVFQPVINGVGGNLVAVQASRISTSLHQVSKLGSFPPYLKRLCTNPCVTFFSKDSHSRTARVLILLVIPGHLIFAYTISYVKAGHTSLTPLFLITYLFVAVLQVALLLHISYVMVHWMWINSVDPDNSAIPYLTALGDLFGTGFLSLAFEFLYLIGDKDSDVGD